MDLYNELIHSAAFESFLYGLGYNYLIQMIIITIVLYSDPLSDHWLGILTSSALVEVYYLLYSCCSAIYHHGIPKDMVSWVTTILVTRGVVYKILTDSNIVNNDVTNARYYTNLFLTFTLKPVVSSVIQLEPVASTTRTKNNERLLHYMSNGNFYLGFGFMYTLVLNFYPDRGDLRLLVYLFKYIPLEYKRLYEKTRSIDRLDEFENIMPITLTHINEL